MEHLIVITIILMFLHVIIKIKHKNDIGALYNYLI